MVGRRRLPARKKVDLFDRVGDRTTAMPAVSRLMAGNHDGGSGIRCIPVEKVETVTVELLEVLRDSLVK